MRNEKGFTLIEMLIVLLIISVLIIVTVPNVTKHFSTIDNKGCDAYVAMAQGQVQAFKIDNGRYPTLAELAGKDYLNVDVEDVQCPNGAKIKILDDGAIEVVEGTAG